MARPPSRARRQGPTEFVGLTARPTPPADRSLLLETARGTALLVAVSGPHRGAEWALRGAVVAIGRGEDAEVRIDEPAASRRHALIERHPDGYYLRDLGSTNGTHLGQLLNGTSVRLRAGQRFRIGETEFIFRDPAEITQEGT